uniref:Uncharacterized protein n=1 Tax=Arundo donax TaxID=35708 RepID=A0A0A9SZ86_ARUDO
MRIGPATPRKSSGSVTSFSVIISAKLHTYFCAFMFFHKSFCICSL